MSTYRGLRLIGAFFDRHAGIIGKVNEQLSALAVALAIIVTLTAACRAPTYWADRTAPPTAIQD